MSPFFYSAAGVVFGGLITGYFAWRASKELRTEASKLRQLVTVLALYMQREGLLKDVELDEAGYLKGYTQTIHAGFIPSEEEPVYGGTVVQGPLPSPGGSSPEPPGGPQTATEEPERAEPRPGGEEAQEGVERPWWRRVLGG